MTEPGARAPIPTLIATTAVRDGDEWVINGHKWFTSNGSVADFLIVMAVTNPDVHPYQGCSMIIVPADTPGVDIVRDVPTMEDPVPHFGKFGGHAEIIYREVRVPVREPGRARGRRLRAGPDATRARAGSTTACAGWASPGGPSTCSASGPCPATTHGSLLADKQTVQNWVADSHGRDDRGPPHDPAGGVEDGPRRGRRRPGSRSP